MPFIHQLAPVPVILPLIIAAVFVATDSFSPRRMLDIGSLLAAGAVVAVSLLLLHASASGRFVYWLGNWRPNPSAGAAGHFPVGICFIIDPVSTGLSAFIALLTFASFAFSWFYFEEVASFYHALMLVFMAAMCGLALSGDLFNLFVWFELMTASAVALCGFKSEESPPLLGALNFAILNTVGAFLSLIGVAFLYAQTGSLNMAEVGRSLASHPPGDPFLLVTFFFLAAGFLVKMAVIPFQFWLADAHAVAPTPVCVLFSGIMVELGLYAIARLHWLVFAPALGPTVEHAIRDLFLGIGAITAITGAVYCFSQRHLKRLLAFSTISHVGLMTIGFALLTPDALAGVAVYLVGHGLVKGALFLGAGILLHRCGSVDEFDLRGATSEFWFLAVILFVAVIGLSGMPPFATFFGESLIHEAAKDLGLHWLPAIAVIAEALTAGAVLRFTVRVFLGWGERREATSRGAPHIPMDQETAGRHDKTPFFMWLPAILLLVIAGGIAFPTLLRAQTLSAIHQFENPGPLAALTLDAAPDPAAPAETPPPAHIRPENIITLCLTLLVAGLALFPQILPRKLNWRLSHGLILVLRPLRRLQSGNPADYLAWFTLGIAAYAGILLLLAR